MGQDASSSWNDRERLGLPHPSDETALQAYVEYYTYDAVGNPLQVRHTAGTAGSPFQNYWTRDFTVDGASNRMIGSAVGGTSESYQYDGRGNLVGGLGHLGSLAYNAANRMSYLDDGVAVAWFYQYDGSGQRVRKWSTGNAERLYVGAWERYAGSKGLVRHSLRAGGCLIETRVAGTDSGDAALNGRLEQLLRFHSDDHLGSVGLELDETGAVISFEEYYPFGSTSFQSGRSTAEVRLKRYRYTGKERDEKSGFNYHGPGTTRRGCCAGWRWIRWRASSRRCSRRITIASTTRSV